MKRLPIAKAVFRDFIEEDLCYVDKTPYIKQLNDSIETYWFLARPRRFGKSLFLDTLRAAFAGEKELFKGLFLEKNWDWNIKYPVITVSFGGGTIKTIEEFQESANFSLLTNAKNYGVELSNKFASINFRELIFKLNEKYNQKVVILIDEYDKPMLDNITKDNVKEIREELAGFYSVLKDTEKYLKFVFITGVSKFSKTSIFSKLNNVQDISLTTEYADICGYTQNDLETTFADYLHDIDMKKVKQWYDGYNFLGKNLYNPYDILLFLKNKEFKPYWFRTGTPTFLLELIEEKKYHIPELENITLPDSEMQEFDLDYIDLNVLLYQAGYLTIKKEIKLSDNYLYNLKIPNKEVRIGLTEYILRMFYTREFHTNDRIKLYERIYYAITDNKPEDLEQAFYSFFAKIPVDWYRKNNINKFEGFYSSMFYAFFAAQGFDIIPEDFTNKGRIDMTVSTETGIFIFEYKMKTNSKNALQQIKDKKYHEKYLNEDKNIFLIGIEFDEEQKNISMFESEKIQ